MIEQLSWTSFKSLKIKDIRHVPEAVWDEFFERWWIERMNRADLYTLLQDSGLETVLKRAVERVLFAASENSLVSCTIEVDSLHNQRHGVWTPFDDDTDEMYPSSSYQRALIHKACPWLGMISKTGVYESKKYATVSIRGRYCQPDDIALITYDQAFEDGADIFVFQPKRRKTKWWW
jgi:hypothetical protein